MICEKCVKEYHKFTIFYTFLLHEWIKNFTIDGRYDLKDTFRRKYIWRNKSYENSLE